MSKVTPQALIEAYINDKNDNNFRKFYQRINPGLKKYIRKFLSSDIPDYDDIVEDIQQNVYLKAFLNLKDYHNLFSFSTWLYVIARNETIAVNMCAEKTKPISTLYEENNDNNYDEDEYLLHKNHSESNYIKSHIDYMISKEIEDLKHTVYQKILNKINCLPNIYNNIIKDRLINDMCYEDIAEKYCLPLNTVKSRIRLGKIHLSNSIDDGLVKEYINIFD